MPTFSDILGQPQAVDVLQRAAEGNRVAGAYLFAGPEGVGKATCAMVLAAALNCETAPGKGCHDQKRCSSCHKFQQNLHPDLVRLEPDGQFIKIAQVRAVEELLSFPPHEGRHRMVLIDGADRLNTNAANALLKSVEEPRPRTLFVLVSSAAHRVTPTLVSRCQRIRFVPLEPEAILAVLARQDVDAGEAQMQAAAGYCEGSAGRALHLLDGDQFANLEQLVHGLVEATTGGSVVQIFDVALEAGRDRKVITDALDLLRIRLRDALLGQAPGSRGEPELSVGAALGQLQAVDEAQAAVRGNVHPTLALENLVLSMRECGARK